MRPRVASFLVVAMVATGVVFAVAQHGRHVEVGMRPYSAIVWLPRGESHARAELVREQCGSAPGAASVSALSRSRAIRTADEFVFSIRMRWAPDDTRSNPLLNCLNDNPGVDHYGIPI
jgi:hypothetical protein